MNGTKISTIQSYVLGAALLAGPSWLAAQMPTQPGQPGQLPNQPGMQVPTGSAANPINPTSPAMTSNNPSPYANDLSTNSSSGIDAQTMRDKMFVRKAANGGYTEVQFGQLAVQKASNQDVKRYAQKMMDDHSMLDENMKPVEDRMGVRTPTRLGKSEQAQYDKLSALSGPDFDKEYLACMVKDHKQDLDDFRTEEGSTRDPNLKEVVGKGEKLVYFHLRWANKLAVANGVAPAPPPAQ